MGLLRKGVDCLRRRVGGVRDGLVRVGDRGRLEVVAVVVLSLSILWSCRVGEKSY